FPENKENERKVAEKIEKIMQKSGLSLNFTDDFDFQSAELSKIKDCYLQTLNRLIETPNSNSTLDWIEIGALPMKCANALNAKLSKFISTPKLYENKQFISPKFNDTCSIITFGKMPSS
uniref:Uncharacterized protein n=1 Tax=Panagrolaimus sp. PS1159 TaxID=55785 RepID=A0AC35GN87_9BILA